MDKMGSLHVFFYVALKATKGNLFDLNVSI
jgi:hypothetical protein